MFTTVKDAFQKSGPCPSTHPVRVAQVSYETIWDTTGFNSLWTSGAQNPFTLSYTETGGGSGTHADYLFGWKGDSLQRAMDSSCMFNACENGRPLKSQGPAQMNKCTVPDMVKEDVNGCEFLFSLSPLASKRELTAHNRVEDSPRQRRDERHEHVRGKGRGIGSVDGGIGGMRVRRQIDVVLRRSLSLK